MFVHGMGNDGSVWRLVYDILRAKGYEVTVVQQSMTGLDEDVKATTRAIVRHEGPVVVVGHSHGGVVFTTAGNDPKVEALVYVAALQPDTGDTMGSLNASMPAAIDQTGVEATADGYITATQAVYRRDVAQDLPAVTADFPTASQVPTAGAVLTPPTFDLAWRH